jgi:hypothetical protein
MKKAASVVSLLALWVLATGCESQKSTRAQVHLRVFEMPTQVLQQNTADQNPRRLSNSVYSVSVVSAGQLEAMLQSNGAPSRMLTDSTRVVSNWPWETDTWVYSPMYTVTEPGAICAGSGVGALGVREQGGHLQVHFDYMVNHGGSQGQKLIESKISYDYNYSEGQVLLFHAPANGTGERPRHHVIAFEISRADRTPDVLAYR